MNEEKEKQVASEVADILAAAATPIELAKRGKRVKSKKFRPPRNPLSVPKPAIPKINKDGTLSAVRRKPIAGLPTDEEVTAKSVPFSSEDIESLEASVSDSLAAIVPEGKDRKNWEDLVKLSVENGELIEVYASLVNEAKNGDVTAQQTWFKLALPILEAIPKERETLGQEEIDLLKAFEGRIEEVAKAGD